MYAVESARYFGVWERVVEWRGMAGRERGSRGGVTAGRGMLIRSNMLKEDDVGAYYME